MFYKIEFKPKSIKDCRNIPKNDLEKLFKKIDNLSDNLSGNVKKLTNFTPEYRMKSGNYRVLFEIDRHKIILYRILHRKDVYIKGGTKW